MDFIKRLLNKIKDVKRRNEEELLKRENVCGVGLKDNQIVVLVEKKLPLDELRPVDVVPSTIDGYETKVIEVGEITASVSGCPVTGTACSIAGVCKKGDSTFYLSNSHCKFNSKGKAYVSPSPMDGGTVSSSKVGVVFEQSNLSGTGTHKVDALIAKADKPQEVKLETDVAKIGDTVNFEGRTSGKQTLKVVADDVTINVNYEGFLGRMTNQIMLEGIVRGGDSGSGLMKNGKICGLIFASNNVNFGFANHIQNVIDEMGISFATKREWKYFKLNETTGRKNDNEMGRIADLNTELVDMLDRAREIAGVPFAINSGYREPAYNKKIGGVNESAHTERLAVDIRCRNSTERFKITTALLEVGFKRLGQGNSFIHADISKTLPQEVMWTY